MVNPGIFVKTRFCLLSADESCKHSCDWKVCIDHSQTKLDSSKELVTVVYKMRALAHLAPWIFLGLKVLSHYKLYQVFVCEVVFNNFLIYILRQNVPKNWVKKLYQVSMCQNVLILYFKLDYRCFRICSSWTKVHRQLLSRKQIFLRNGYPETFINKCFKDL